MKNKRGFIQIPILIGIIIGIFAIASTGYISYRVGKTEQNNSNEKVVASVSTTTNENNETASTEVKNDGDNSVIDSLKKEIGDLRTEVASNPKSENLPPAQVDTKTQTKIVSLPNGAIVEIGASGNILRYIQQPTTKTSTDITPSQSSTVTTSPSLQISNPEIITGITTGRIEWETSIPTESKVFVTGGGFLSQVFQSESGVSTHHIVDLKGFSIKNDIVYSYEIEAIEPNSTNFVKKSGTFKLLTRPYADILAEIKPLITFNPSMSCSQLFSTPDQFLVCVDYESGI